MMNVEEVIKNMKESIGVLEEALKDKEIKKVEVEHGFTPEFDRTHIWMWVYFTDGTQASLPIGWYQGDPNTSDTLNYAHGDIVWVSEEGFGWNA